MKNQGESSIRNKARREEVTIAARGVSLEGELTIPAKAAGVVLFAHGSGSSRHSPRNQYVARVLQRAAMATLLMDLMTSREEAADSMTAELRFNIELLAQRLIGATEWLGQNAGTRELPVVYFGASTGAAAALVAAAGWRQIKAVVSRGGRPDLAGPALKNVKAPTLLIVGGDDLAVIELNREALAELECEKRLEIIHGATHLFEEPGKLEEVAQLARTWFEKHLQRRHQKPRAA
jgi:dienelactone hydrolase